MFLVVRREKVLVARQREFTEKENLAEHEKFLLGKCGVFVSVLHIKI